MSWFTSARDLVVRWGKPVRFAAKHVIAAVPGGSLVADMVDKVLECVQDTAEDQAQADVRIRSQLSEQELQQIAGILAECQGQLSGLMQQLVALDGLPDAADRIIRMQRATDERIQAGFANLARFAEQFDRIEAGVGRVEAKVDRLEEQIRQLAERNHVRGDETRKMTVSITNEKEREVLRKLRDEYRKLPSEQQNVEALTLLADSLSAAGQFSQAQEMHAEAARRAAAANKGLAARNHYQHYRDACELGQWPEALAALLEAVRLDPAYRPFSLVQYVPQAILGAGGFGTVLRCEDRYAAAEERAVAVKTLHTAELARTVQEVFAEAHIIKALKHPAIIGVRAWGCVDDDEARPFIVMEYFEGDSLAKHLRQHGKLEPADAVAIARQVASGMSAAHKARVYHRDLKPDNILVRKNGAAWELRLIDFGLAVSQQATGKSVLCPPESRSVSDRSYAGTFKYAPPEQKNERDPISGKVEKVGPYSDVYTFGKTFCEALFGTTAPKSFHYDKLPPEFQPLHPLLERCTADAVEERVQDFGAVMEALEALDPEKAARKRRQEEGETLLVQRFREILDRSHGKPATDDMAALGKLCKEYGIGKEQGNVIVAQERKRWDTAHPQKKEPPPPPKKERQPGEIMSVALPGNIAMRFAWCPPGTFLMGSPENEPNRSGDETQHRVTLTKGFWLGVTPVTQAQWQAVMGGNPSNWKGTNLPVERVSWDDCQEFRQKLSSVAGNTFRLPTEAEREYAYRAGTQTVYYFGADAGPLSEYAWFDGNSGNQTRDVGQKKPNAWGLYDMAGNVWEWCNDWYGKDYGRSDSTDPQGLEQGSDRVNRGGGWVSDPLRCRAAERNGDAPSSRGFDLGFRLAVPVR